MRPDAESTSEDAPSSLCQAFPRKLDWSGVDLTAPIGLVEDRESRAESNGSMVRALAPVLMAACASTLGAQDSDFTLDVDFRLNRSIDRVLTKVDANEDVWIGEQDYQGIDAELKRIARSLRDDPGSFEPLAEQARGFRSLRLAEFKILSTRRDTDSDNLARVAVRAELGGESTSGGLLSRLGMLEMSWRKGSSGWTLETAVPTAFRDLSARALGFSEITDQVFSGIESFRKQLRLGVDHWRDSLDAAVGVSVYGHQGVSLGDFDGDGLDDLYVSQPSGLPNRLYRNNGDGTFSDATRRAGLDVLDDTSMSLFGDFDNDGDQDLFLISATPLLYRNVGDGRFELDVDAGLDVPPDSAAMFTGAAAGDYDLDGDLDIYVCAYDFWQPAADYDAPTPYYDAINGPPNLLLRNDGQGRFAEVSTEAGLTPSNNRFSFAAAWGDYDDDGDPDLYVANDFGRNNLYRNNGDGTFVDVAEQLGVEDLGAGMSAAWGDYDNDGDLDLYTANMWSSAGQRITLSTQFDDVAPGERERAQFRRQALGNSLFRNEGAAGFSDASNAAGVRTGRWAWASDFVDLNGDGLLDLFVQNGYITGERLDDL